MAFILSYFESNHESNGKSTALLAVWPRHWVLHHAAAGAALVQTGEPTSPDRVSLGGADLPGTPALAVLLGNAQAKRLKPLLTGCHESNVRRMRQGGLKAHLGQHGQGDFNGHGSGSGSCRPALLRGIDRCSTSRQHQATADGQEHQGLEQQQEDPQGRASRYLHPGLNQQGEQQQHGGLEGQHLGRAERAKGVEKHSQATTYPILAGCVRRSGLFSGVQR